jgi:glycosyltransferase involved in cell wall biosynthesis
MPVYNGEKYLKEAIESILCQTFKNFEFLIINDASTDSTEDIIFSYKDERIVYIKNEKNLKLVKSLNKGIDIARGKFIARMDADDISYPHRLETQIEYLMQNNDCAMVGSWAEVINEQGEIFKYREPPTDYKELKAQLFFYNRIVHSSVMGKAEVFREFKYDEKFLDAEDYYLWTLITEKYKFYNLDQYLLKYRLHDCNVSELNSDNQKESFKKVVELQISRLGIKIERDRLMQHFLIFYPHYPNKNYFKKINYRRAFDWLNLLRETNHTCQRYDPEFFNKTINFYCQNLRERKRKSSLRYNLSKLKRNILTQIKQAKLIARERMSR